VQAFLTESSHGLGRFRFRRNSRVAYPSPSRHPGGRRRGAPLVQPGREFGESKSKEMKAKLLSFPFISFSESGLFKGLRPIQIKKSGLASQVVRKMSQTQFSILFPLRAPGCTGSIRLIEIL
jgi:hypothetical protein